MSTATGTVIDKATALKNSVVGNNMNKIVCKASSREMLGPKKKHVDYLIHMSNDARVSMPVLADLLADRLRNSNWVTVFKALISSHNLMTLGNERFLQCLATRSSNFNLDLFQDKSDLIASDMSLYIRQYANYLTALCGSYRVLAVDLCRVTKGEGGVIRKMETAKLLKTATQIHLLLEKILELKLQISELNNGVINTAFLMLYKDLIKLFHAYNDAMINLLEKFFDMKKAEAKEAVVVYAKFPPMGDRIKLFLQVAKDVGIDKDAALNIKSVPEDLLPALENHIKELDGRKSSTVTTPIKLLQGGGQSTKGGKSPAVDQSLVEAQQKRMETLKQQRSITTPPKNTPSVASAGVTSSPADDLIGLDSTSFTASLAASSSPWQKTPSPTPPVQQQPVQPVTSSNPWGQPSGGYQEVNFFAGGQQPSSQDFGSAFPVASGTSNGVPLGGEILLPTVNQESPQMQKPQPRNLGRNLEKGLTNAVENLSLGLDKTGTGLVPQKGQHQWKEPTSSVKTGGPNWQPGMQTSVPPPVQPVMAPHSGGGGMMGYGGGVVAGTGYYGMGQPAMSGYGGGTMMQQPAMSGGVVVGAGWNQPTANPSLTAQPSFQQQDPFGPIAANQRPLF